MRTNFVLIDSENVKPEYIEKLKQDHFRVCVFVGPKLKCLDMTIVNAVQSLGFNGSYIQTSRSGKDALDFHIAYYIGKLSAAHPDAYFHIISKDKGFDPLIKHLKEQKIFCCRSESILKMPPFKSTGGSTAKQRAKDFYDKRLASNKALPATVKALQSTISHFDKGLSAKEITAVVEALKAAGHVVLNGKKVTYPSAANKSAESKAVNEAPESPVS